MYIKKEENIHMSKILDIPAIIFAGGKSARMGKDKALISFADSNSLAEFQYKKLERLFKNVYISSKTNKFDFNAKIIYDISKESSPMVGLYSVFKELSNDVVFILSVDMPMIEATHIDKLIRIYLDTNPKPDILMANSHRGNEPLFGIYDKNILPEIELLLLQNNHRMKDLSDRVNTQRHFFHEQDAFININTPRDYQMANSKIISSCDN